MSEANRSASSGEKTPVSIASMASASLGDAAMAELACKAARRRSSISSARKPKMNIVLCADVVANLDIRPVQRADRERTVQGKLHVASAGSFHSRRRNLLG